MTKREAKKLVRALHPSAEAVTRRGQVWIRAAGHLDLSRSFSTKDERAEQKAWFAAAEYCREALVAS